MRISDWSSDVCSSDLGALIDCIAELAARFNLAIDWGVEDATDEDFLAGVTATELLETAHDQLRLDGYTLWTWETGTTALAGWMTLARDGEARSEEHTSELQSLMRISYAVFCLHKKNISSISS